jgi:NAD(P)-dependent dehydrogenase (short-subunit alcohol dehydrogenase family)
MINTIKYGNYKLKKTVRKGKGNKAVTIKKEIIKQYVSELKGEDGYTPQKGVDYFGGIDIAVNNAGIEGTPDVKTADYEENVWDDVIAINLKGVWLSMKFQLPEMQKRGKGAIVNVASLAGLQGGGAGIGYHAAKFGVVGMTKATALEYAKDNIRVNAVCPAVIETPMADRAFDTTEKRNKAIAMHPVGRLGTTKEVVDTICWLASDEASFVTGTALAVDGGANL